MENVLAPPYCYLLITFALLTLPVISSAAVAPLSSSAHGYALNSSWWEPVTVRSQSVIVGARSVSSGKSVYKGRVEALDGGAAPLPAINQTSLADMNARDGSEEMEEETSTLEVTTLANNGTAEFIKWTPMRAGLLIAAGRQYGFSGDTNLCFIHTDPNLVLFVNIFIVFLLYALAVKSGLPAALKHYGQPHHEPTRPPTDNSQ